jgi:hypothetical protein
VVSYSSSFHNILATASMGPCYSIHICQPVATTATAVSRETDSIYDIIKKSSPSLALWPYAPGLPLWGWRWEL